MNKIKVCQFVCGLEGGGAEQVIYNYCSKMDREEYEFYLVYQHKACKKNLKEFESLNFKLFNIPSKVSHPFKNFYYTNKIIKENKFDVIHTHMNIMNFIPLICGWLNGTKIRISHSHTCDIRKKNVLIKAFEYACKKLSILFATDLVACGEAAGKYMYGRRKFVIIHNAINTKKFEFNLKIRNQTRKRIGVNKNTKLLGNVGRFTEAKNHLFLLDIFEELYKVDDSYKLLLVGDGELKNDILKKINDLKIKDGVILVGNVDDTSSYYQAMDLFLMPSKWEGLPLAGIEAQASGLKSFFSDKVSDEVIISKNAYKKSIENKEIWVQAIINSDYRYERKNNIINLQFDIEKEVKKLLEIYKK